MAVIFFEPVRQYGATVANITRWWTQFYLGSSNITIGDHFTNGPGIRFGSALSIAKTVSPSSAAGVLGFRFRHNATGGDGFATLRSFETQGVDGGTIADYSMNPTHDGSSLTRYLGSIAGVRSGGMQQMCLSIEHTGKLTILRGGAGDLRGPDMTAFVAQSDNALSVDAEHFIEWEWLISATVGLVKVWVDGDVWIDETGLNTKSLDSGVSADWDEFYIGHFSRNAGSTATWDYRDIYLLDKSTPTNNTLVDALGPVVIDWDYPSADGANTDWTPTSASTHYDEVDDTVPDDDTTRITSTVAGDQDSFQHVGLPIAGATPVAVAVMFLARTDTGPTSTRPFIRIGSTNYDIGSAQANAGSYVYQAGVVNTKPSDSTAFSEADYDAMEPGVTKVS